MAKASNHNIICSAFSCLIWARRLSTALAGLGGSVAGLGGSARGLGGFASGGSANVS